MKVDRRSFLGVLPVGAGLAFANGELSTPGKRPSPVHERYPTADWNDVREIVRWSHSDFDRVKKIVERRPELSKASWDWGFGDWESALGAASHMGNREIAQLLIDHGARPNLFTHAMMGHVDVVRATVDASPGVQSIPGPHGMTLVTHARAGGEAAASVLEYLLEKGGADPKISELELTDERKKQFVGRYRFHDGENDLFEVRMNSRGALSIRRAGEEFGPRLFHVEENGFSPSGSPSVRIRFQFQRGSVMGMSIHDPDPTIGARRLAD